MDQGMAFPPGAPSFGTSTALWRLSAASMNTTADQAFSKTFGFANFTIDRVIVTNASSSLTLAVGGIYGAASKGAPILVAAAQVYSALTSGTKILNPTLTAAAGDMLTLSNIYLSLTTGQGSAATADFTIIGIAWS